MEINERKIVRFLILSVFCCISPRLVLFATGICGFVFYFRENTIVTEEPAPVESPAPDDAPVDIPVEASLLAPSPTPPIPPVAKTADESEPGASSPASSPPPIDTPNEAPSPPSVDTPREAPYAASRPAPSLFAVDAPATDPSSIWSPAPSRQCVDVPFEAPPLAPTRAPSASRSVMSQNRRQQTMIKKKPTCENAVSLPAQSHASQEHAIEQLLTSMEVRRLITVVGGGWRKKRPGLLKRIWNRITGQGHKNVETFKGVVMENVFVEVKRRVLGSSRSGGGGVARKQEPKTQIDDGCMKGRRNRGLSKGQGGGPNRKGDDGSGGRPHGGPKEETDDRSTEEGPKGGPKSQAEDTKMKRDSARSKRKNATATKGKFGMTGRRGKEAERRLRRGRDVAQFMSGALSTAGAPPTNQTRSLDGNLSSSGARSTRGPPTDPARGLSTNPGSSSSSDASSTRGAGANEQCGGLNANASDEFISPVEFNNDAVVTSARVDDIDARVQKLEDDRIARKNNLAEVATNVRRLQDLEDARLAKEQRLKRESEAMELKLKQEMEEAARFQAAKDAEALRLKQESEVKAAREAQEMKLKQEGEEAARVQVAKEARALCLKQRAKARKQGSEEQKREDELAAAELKIKQDAEAAAALAKSERLKKIEEERIAAEREFKHLADEKARKEELERLATIEAKRKQEERRAADADAQRNADVKATGLKRHESAESPKASAFGASLGNGRTQAEIVGSVISQPFNGRTSAFINQEYSNSTPAAPQSGSTFVSGTQHVSTSFPASCLPAPPETENSKDGERSVGPTTTANELRAEERRLPNPIPGEWPVSSASEVPVARSPGWTDSTTVSREEDNREKMAAAGSSATSRGNYDDSKPIASAAGTLSPFQKALRVADKRIADDHVPLTKRRDASFQPFGVARSRDVPVYERPGVARGTDKEEYERFTSKQKETRDDKERDDPERKLALSEKKPVREREPVSRYASSFMRRKLIPSDLENASSSSTRVSARSIEVQDESFKVFDNGKLVVEKYRIASEREAKRVADEQARLQREKSARGESGLHAVLESKGKEVESLVPIAKKEEDDRLALEAESKRQEERRIRLEGREREAHRLAQVKVREKCELAEQNRKDELEKQQQEAQAARNAEELRLEQEIEARELEFEREKKEREFKLKQEREEAARLQAAKDAEELRLKKESGARELELKKLQEARAAKDAEALRLKQKYKARELKLKQEREEAARIQAAKGAEAAAARAEFERLEKIEDDRIASERESKRIADKKKELDRLAALESKRKEKERLAAITEKEGEDRKAQELRRKQAEEAEEARVEEERLRRIEKERAAEEKRLSERAAETKRLQDIEDARTKLESRGVANKTARLQREKDAKEESDSLAAIHAQKQKEESERLAREADSRRQEEERINRRRREKEDKHLAKESVQKERKLADSTAGQGDFQTRSGGPISSPKWKTHESKQDSQGELSEGISEVKRGGNLRRESVLHHDYQEEHSHGKRSDKKKCMASTEQELKRAKEQEPRKLERAMMESIVPKRGSTESREPQLLKKHEPEEAYLEWLEREDRHARIKADIPPATQPTTNNNHTGYDQGYDVGNDIDPATPPAANNIYTSHSQLEYGSTGNNSTATQLLRSNIYTDYSQQHYGSSYGNSYATQPNSSIQPQVALSSSLTLETSNTNLRDASPNPGLTKSEKKKERISTKPAQNSAHISGTSESTRRSYTVESEKDRKPSSSTRRAQSSVSCKSSVTSLKPAKKKRTADTEDKLPIKEQSRRKGDAESREDRSQRRYEAEKLRKVHLEPLEEDQPEEWMEPDSNQWTAQTAVGSDDRSHYRGSGGDWDDDNESVVLQSMGMDIKQEPPRTVHNLQATSSFQPSPHASATTSSSTPIVYTSINNSVFLSELTRDEAKADRETSRPATEHSRKKGSTDSKKDKMLRTHKEEKTHREQPKREQHEDRMKQEPTQWTAQAVVGSDGRYYHHERGEYSEDDNDYSTYQNMGTDIKQKLPVMGQTFPATSSYSKTPYTPALGSSLMPSANAQPDMPSTVVYSNEDPYTSAGPSYSTYATSSPSGNSFYTTSPSRQAYPAPQDYRSPAQTGLGSSARGDRHSQRLGKDRRTSGFKDDVAGASESGTERHKGSLSTQDRADSYLPTETQQEKFKGYQSPEAILRGTTVSSEQQDREGLEILQNGIASSGLTESRGRRFSEADESGSIKSRKTTSRREHELERTFQQRIQSQESYTKDMQSQKPYSTGRQYLGDNDDGFRSQSTVGTTSAAKMPLKSSDYAGSTCSASAVYTEGDCNNNYKVTPIGMAASGMTENRGSQFDEADERGSTKSRKTAPRREHEGERTRGRHGQELDSNAKGRESKQIIQNSQRKQPQQTYLIGREQLGDNNNGFRSRSTIGTTSAEKMPMRGSNDTTAMYNGNGGYMEDEYDDDYEVNYEESAGTRGQVPESTRRGLKKNEEWRGFS